MVGISGIQSRIDRRTSSETSAELRKELWFKDGDQAFMSIVATGDEDDPRLADYWMYTFNDEGRWTSVLGGAKEPDLRTGSEFGRLYTMFYIQNVGWIRGSL